MINQAKTMTPAERFFWKHAGYSYNPEVETRAQGRRRGATALAEAEARARHEEITFEWDVDEGGCIGCCCESPDCKCATGEPHEVLVCYAIGHDTEEGDSGPILASLGGICEPDAHYRRVVEAELALEALS